VTGRKSTGVFLKSIQIQGFKSFADKIRLDLEPGLSVIVGPNGSGKSNTADAVRWVLGEQSAKSLRGSKMEDVIFAGSSTRRPVGMAEVSLFFDNSSGLFPLAYQEVVITRRVFRDGEGQFFINKTPCRLKDIQELFMDTGSGKEGFSIIGQGRIEEILNLKAEERRLLIEEVAGISKFRLRKKEALKKLEDTQQNIDRLSDILSEVESRLEPLAQQADKAKNCTDLNIQLKGTEIKLIVNDLADNNSKLKKFQSNAEEFNTELAILNTKIAEEENIFMRGKLEINELEERLQDLQGLAYSLENSVTETTHEISLIVERKRYSQEQLGRLEKEIILAEEKISVSRDKYSKLLEKETALQNALTAASASLKELEDKLHNLKNLNGEGRREELKTEIFEELSAKSKLTNELAELEHEKESLKKQENQQVQDAVIKQQEKNDLIKQVDQQDNKMLEIEELLVLLGQKTAENKKAMDLKKEQLLRIDENSKVLTRQIDQVSARHHALQTLEENLEGYQKGVRETVLAHRKGEINCSVYGTVADNIEVEAKFELAVETALGSSLQNIIVDRTDDGEECIAYLKKTNNGRATFLPLDSIKGGRLLLEPKVKDHRGLLGLAVDLVKYDQRFGAVMESMLGRILIADNMDSAIELARMNNYRFRVVTLQGDQVNTGGSLTGGSIRKQGNGLLSRARVVEDLAAKILELKADLEVIKQKHMTCDKEFEDLKVFRQDLDLQIKACNETKSIMTVDRKHTQERINRLEESEKIIQFELTDIRAQYSGLEGKIIVTRRKVDESSQKIIASQKEQENLEKLLKETNIQTEELSQRITAAKIETARWEQEFTQTEQLALDENELIETSRELCEEKKTEMAILQQTEADLGRRQGEAENNLREITLHHNEKKYQLTELRKEREGNTSKNIQIEKMIHDKNRQAKEIEQQLHQNELRIIRQQAEWETGCSRLKEEFNCTWEEAFSLGTEEKKEDLQEKIIELKSRIEELGPVNYAALEEYPQTLQRFDFLSVQKNDLVEAANSLYNLISELDDSMIKRFQQGFKDVNNAFQEVFKQLFNGGYAELQLDDPENLLDTGVKIVAQPPGKKAQLLSLLSGGERSFTAIALLFAFLKVKPSPFCLLDEIEAALDEANVKRFISYLRTLSEHTQFIVISHRRGTMESADKLYGITMEESGVSKLLTVEMEEQMDHDIA